MDYSEIQQCLVNCPFTTESQTSGERRREKSGKESLGNKSWITPRSIQVASLSLVFYGACDARVCGAITVMS
jgi:hypothetical protein